MARRMKIRLELPGIRNNRLLWIAFSLLLCALGTLRMARLVFHEPLLAYANNYDMIRIQACHDIWSVLPEIKPGMNSPEAPLLAFKFDHTLNLGPCFPSSELLFTGLSVGLIHSNLFYSTDEPFSIRVFGIVRGLSLAVLAVLVSGYLLAKKHTTAALLNSLIYAAVLTDPANMLYLSTFYTEFSALFFLYLSIVLLFLIETWSGRFYPSLGLGICLLLLGLSKPQHALLPVGLLACLVVVNLRDLCSIRTTLSMGILAITFLGFFQAQNLGHTRYSNQMVANATNVYLGAVLPSASDPYAAAANLGLPRHCVDHAGDNWYTPGLQDNHPCPEVVEVPRLRIFSLIAMDPTVVVNMTSTGLQFIRPWISDLGQVEGQIFGKVMDYVFSLSAWLDKPGEQVTIAVFFLPILALLGGIVALFCKPSDRVRRFLLMEFMLISSLYMIFYSALLGDGFADLSKHAHLLFSVYLSWVLITLAGVGAWIWYVVGSRIASKYP